MERVQNRNLKRGGSPGRKKGSLNIVTRQIAEFAKSLLEDPEYQAKLKARLLAGKAPHLEPILFYYAYGKPKERVELSGGVEMKQRYRERFQSVMNDEELKAAALKFADKLTEDNERVIH